MNTITLPMLLDHLAVIPSVLGLALVAVGGLSAPGASMRKPPGSSSRNACEALS